MEVAWATHLLLAKSGAQQPQEELSRPINVADVANTCLDLSTEDLVPALALVELANLPDGPSTTHGWSPAQGWAALAWQRLRGS
jgi:hypothetical protein